MTGRHAAWMVVAHLRISDTGGTVLDLSDIPKVEHRHDNVHPLRYKMGKRIIAMKKKSDGEVLELQAA